MIPEFLSFVLLVSAVVGLGFWWVWFRYCSNSQGEPQSMGRHEGSLPDSFFDPCPRIVRRDPRVHRLAQNPECAPKVNYP